MTNKDQLDNGAMMQLTDELKPCPFCGAAATLMPIARDWWRVIAYHDDECMLSGDEPTAPQTPENKAALVAAWNRRALLSASQPAAPTAPPAKGWTGHHEADNAIILLGRLDVSTDDDVRVDQIEAAIRYLAMQALAASPAAPAQSVEPVAWMTEGKYPSPRFIIGKKDPSDVWKEKYVPLYAAPQQPAQAGEPVSQLLEDDSSDAKSAFEKSANADMSNRDDLWPVWQEAWEAAHAQSATVLDERAMPPNITHVVRRIRRCENETAAQLVLEHFAMEYARAASAQATATQTLTAEQWREVYNIARNASSYNAFMRVAPDVILPDERANGGES